MYQLFHLPNASSQRIIWLFIALDVSFELIFCERNAKGQAVDRHYLNPTLYEQLAFINTHLAKKLSDTAFFMGEHLTAVDILIQFMLSALAVSVPNFERYSAIDDYLTRIETLPSYQSALAKGQFDKSIFLQYWQKAW